MFEDAGFKTIGENIKDGLSENAYTWKRPSSQSTALSLWGDKGITPTGIKQGGVGDCWFLAAASSVAEHPERIKRIIWNDKYDEHGAFRFYFWVKDKWHAINIDDRLPWAGSSPAFAKKSVNNAWWFSLMEKAYAKLDQKYFRLHGGMPFEALRNLTNMPTFWVYFASHQKTEAVWWTQLSDLAKRNYPMTSPCCNTNGASSKGLVSGHAYSALDFVQLSNGQKLAKMRNPWSAVEWNGDYSDNSDKWTAKLKEEVGLNATGSDGTFYMPFEDYIKEMWGYSIALYHPYKGYEKLDYQQDQKTRKFTISNPVAQEMYVQTETYSSRNHPKDCKPGASMSATLYGADGRSLGWPHFAGINDWTAFSFHGDPGKSLPAGTYRLQVTDYKYASTYSKKMSINMYWGEQKGEYRAVF